MLRFSTGAGSRGCAIRSRFWWTRPATMHRRPSRISKTALASATAARPDTLPDAWIQLECLVACAADVAHALRRGSERKWRGGSRHLGAGTRAAMYGVARRPHFFRAVAGTTNGASNGYRSSRRDQHPDAARTRGVHGSRLANDRPRARSSAAARQPSRRNAPPN